MSGRVPLALHKTRKAGPLLSFYQLYELNHAALGPFRAAADVAQSLRVAGPTRVEVGNTYCAIARRETPGVPPEAAHPGRSRAGDGIR